MTDPRAHWMDPAEIAQWRQASASAPPQPSPAASAKKEKPLSQARLNERALAAARVGDIEALRAALDLGANPNARERAKPMRSALTVALQNHHDDAALALLFAGGLRSPDRWRSTARPGGDDNEQFNAMASKRPFQAAQMLPIFHQLTLDAFAHGATQWASIAGARAFLKSERPIEELVAINAKNRRWNIVKSAFEAGVADLSLAWTANASYYDYRFSNPKDQPHLDSFLALIRTPAAVASLPAKPACAYFRAAIAHSDPELIGALLDAGLRPSADWTIPCGSPWDNSLGYFPAAKEEPAAKDPFISALSLAAACEGQAFALLRRCAPAVLAAQRRADSPWVLASIPVARLMELRELGVPLDALDSQGRNLLHVWAQMDSAPRAGWATVAREIPALFNQLDGGGKTAAERMAEKLPAGGPRDAFRASLSRIESREIRLAAPRERAKAPAPKRSRL